MTQAADHPDLDVKLGDHVCAFCNGGADSLGDIVVDHITNPHYVPADRLPG